jgi:thioredoxin 1
MKEPIHVNDAAFEKAVLKSTVPVIVDFWAPWCGPCRMVAPVLEKLAAEYENKMIVAKVNTDENPEWAMKYGVQGIPTMLFVQNGQIIDRIVGAVPYPVIKGRLDKMLTAQVTV